MNLDTWWSINGKPVHNANGRFLGYRGTGRDITVEVRAAQALEQARDTAVRANEAKSDFLAHMSHELLTPLNAILGFSETMAQQILGRLGSETYIDYAKSIHASGQHLLQVLNDLLDLSKIESGRAELDEEEIALDVLVDGCVRMVTGRIREHRHDLATNDIANVRVRVDVRKLRQVLLNLLSNAVKFTPDGGHIAMTAAIEPNGDLRISICDDGIGMTPAQLPSALEPFRQLEDRYVRTYDGTGLGLPLSKGLVELHGGTLAMESTPGEGTTVQIRLPADRVLASGDAAQRKLH